MSFTSLEYAAFFSGVFALYWVAPVRSRRAILLAASYGFYASFGAEKVALLLFDTVVAFGAPVLAERANERSRRHVIDAGVVAVLAALVVSKLTSSGGSALGGVAVPESVGLAIPIGLSFYTFQAISYLVDVRRGQQSAERSLLDVALYLAFFPHLLAGPVIRARRLIPAFHGVSRRPSAVEFNEGAEMLLLGVFSKVVFADPLLVQGFDRLDRVESFDAITVWLVLLLVVLGAFFDIAGYTWIVRGSARLLGIRMQANLAQPLTRSRDVGDLWRRWQVTLMAWFRDYVYLPLRGRRPSLVREYAAIAMTFLTVGLWHGLSPTWIAWGLGIGAVVVAERALQHRSHERARQRVPVARGRWWTWSEAAARRTYVLVFSMIVVPLPTSVEHGLRTTYGQAFGGGGGVFDGEVLGYALVAAAGLILVDRRDRALQASEGRSDPVTAWRALGFAVMVLGIIVYSGGTSSPLIYSRF